MKINIDESLNTSIISSIDNKTNILFRSIIDNIEDYVDTNSRSTEILYDTLSKIDDSVKAIISNSNATNNKKKELISLYEDKINKQKDIITFYQTENQKYINREKSMMKFEKDLFNSKEFRDQDLKYILFQAKKELKEIKTNYKTKELKYLCTINDQLNLIKKLKQNIDELNTYIENNITKGTRARNTKSFLFPYLYRQFEREEINTRNKKKKQPRLFSTRTKDDNEYKATILKQLFQKFDTNMDTYLTVDSNNYHNHFYLSPQNSKRKIFSPQLKCYNTSTAFYINKK